jgi:protein-S-isoprenylcysteine O-methyltransferase Ste14
MLKYLLHSVLWVNYFVLHSILAMDSVKFYFSSKLGKWYRHYRIVYSAFSAIVLLVLLFFGFRISSLFLMKTPEWLRYASVVLSIFGAWIIKASFRQYNFTAFVGMKPEIEKLSFEGVSGKVRHPIYSGLILLVTGFYFLYPTLSTLIFCLSVCIYLPIGIRLEERKLIKRFGKDYLNYMIETPALIPRLIKGH